MKKYILSKLCLLFALGLVSVCFTSCGGEDDNTIVIPTPDPVSDDEASQIFTVGDVSFTMKKVAGGTYTMGAQSEDAAMPNYDANAYSNESPVHDVTLNDFWIGETEVTQELWVAVMDTNFSSFISPNHPIETVNWYDVQVFILALNAMTGKNFRLPSESEWEYAARGGKKSAGTKYSGSNTVGDVSWYWDNTSTSSQPQSTQAIKTKQPNELGLYDMSGNVYEWCEDDYANYVITPVDGSAYFNITALDSDRVIRGGSWSNSARNTRVSYRGSYAPDSRHNFLGFRLCSSN